MTAPLPRSQPEAAALRQHTPTPWRVEPDQHFGPGFVITAEGMGNRCPVVRMSSPLGDADEALKGDAELIVEAVNSHSALKSRVEEQARTIDLLEANARVQAKLLADTGRRAEELTKALIEAKLQIEYVQGKNGYATGETVLARIRSALSLEQEKSHHG